MATSELETQIERFKVNEERLNTFVNVDGFYTTSSGVQVPTLLNVSKRIEASVENVSLAQQSATLEIERQTDLVIAASTSAQEEFLNEDSKINTLAKNTIADWQTAITTITQTEGVPALAVSTANNETQQEINDSVGAKWYGKGGGYPINYRVMLDNGDIVKSTEPNNTNNPNVNMTGWVKTNLASQVFDESGLSQQQVNNRLLKSKIIDLSYLSPPNDFDFTTVLNATLQLSQQHPIYVIMPSVDLKITDSVSTGTSGKGCILDLNGSTIYVDKRSESDQKLNGHEYNSVILYSTTDTPCAVINGVIDGSRREQNLFRETDYLTLHNKITNGVFISAKTIAFDGLKLRHMYGQTSKFENANLVNIKDSEITNCGGHWYQNNAYDAFGDAFYIKTGNVGQEQVNVNIERVNVVAKSSDQYPENSAMFPIPKYSRIGVALESLESDIASNVSLTIRDSSFDKVERFLHQEQKQNGNVYIENSIINSVVTFGAYLTDNLKVTSNFNKFKMLAGDYNGSKGLARLYNSASLNVEVNGGVIDGNNFEYTFGNGASSLVLNDVKTIGVNGRIMETPTGLKVNKGSIKFNDTPSSGWLTGVNGDYYFDGVALDATSTTLREFNYGVPTSIKNCSFKNMLIGRGFERYYDKRNFHNNKLYINSGVYAELFGSSFEINNLAGDLLREECLMWGANSKLGVDGLFTRKTVARSTGGAPLALIGSEELELGKKRPLVLVVVRASANPEFFAINEISHLDNKAFYVAVAKYDATTNTYSVVKPFVASHTTPTYQLTFSGLTVSTYGAGVTNVHWAVLPYSEMQSLPVIPDSIIL